MGKEYDLETLAQIEEYFKKKAARVHLSKGNWFGLAKNKGIYFIEFNYLSIPASAQQHNTKSHYGRWCRRLPIKQPQFDNEALTEKEKKRLKEDKHFLWRKFYKPLSSQDFEDQMNDEEMKQNLKCTVCLEMFEKKNLIETQRCEEVKDENAENENEENEEDEKQQEENGKQHRFDLSKASDLVLDDTVVGLSNCAYGHYFHAECIQKALDQNSQCPNCKQKYGVIVGHQPNGRMYVTKARQRCVGFKDAADSVKMLFEFPGGIQKKFHPNPGKIYFGDLREAYMPNNEAGREAAMLIRLAYKRRLLFTVGRSLTLNQDNRIIFGSIHLKTSTSGGVGKHGWPDKTYFTRLKDELKQKGITTDLFTKLEDNFIDNGFPKSEAATE